MCRDTEKKKRYVDGVGKKNKIEKKEKKSEAEIN